MASQPKDDLTPAEYLEREQQADSRSKDMDVVVSCGEEPYEDDNDDTLLTPLVISEATQRYDRGTKSKFDASSTTSLARRLEKRPRRKSYGACFWVGYDG